MLDSKTTKKILDFIYVKPRSIQEVAFHIAKNWRTADSYVDRIIKEQGVLACRIFREGTRGALKIVYWNNIEKIHSSDFQERLYKRIEAAQTKEDFSPFDIYQYVDEKKRSAFLEEQSEYTITEKQNLVQSLRSAQKQVLIFSGNLSWAHASQGRRKIIDIFEELASRNVSIKILCRVDLESIQNIERMLEINHKTRKEMIEIRHSKQPFRAFIIDDTLVRFKEMKQAKPKSGAEKSALYIFYDIRDEEWVEWLSKVFWNMFRTSISGLKRMSDLRSIEKIRKR
ncbi:MAG: hypothetical protein WC916_02440 [Candidatus Woesearchaeota archaeon]